ncbi:MAG: phosphate acetyltransferase, partial [Lachnospiraceae bacterium]|nr:phosphate acetyltransferase [Candidatus Minthocola equi]
MGFIEQIKQRAAADKKRIILPESMDKRTYDAAMTIKKEGFADIIMIAKKEDLAKFAEYDLTGITIVDPDTDPRTQGYIDKLVELRSAKGMTPEEAKNILSTDYTYYGVMMVKMGDADGLV